MLCCVVDLVVQAKSGTGKTIVFATIALESLITTSSAVQVRCNCSKCVYVFNLDLLVLAGVYSQKLRYGLKTLQSWFNV